MKFRSFKKEISRERYLELLGTGCRVKKMTMFNVLKGDFEYKYFEYK